jgi:hypothetical protein
MSHLPSLPTLARDESAFTTGDVIVLGACGLAVVLGLVFVWVAVRQNGRAHRDVALGPTDPAARISAQGNRRRARLQIAGGVLITLLPVVGLVAMVVGGPEDADPWLVVASLVVLALLAIADWTAIGDWRDRLKIERMSETDETPRKERP